MSKSKTTLFDRTYQGPRGRHLSYRTHFTISGEMPKMGGQVSIHPSKWMAGKTVRQGEKD